MSNLILLSALLLPPSAPAADPAAKPAGEKTATVSWENGKCKLPENPFANPNNMPQRPVNHGAISVDTEIPDSALGSLRFGICDEARRGALAAYPDKTSCDGTMARVLKHHLEGGRAFRKIEELCKKAETEAQACEADQTKAFTCLSALATKFTTELDPMVKKFEQASTELLTRHKQHQAASKQVLGTAYKDTVKKRPKIGKFLQEVGRGGASDRVIKERLSSCIKEGKDGGTSTHEYCSHLAAAGEAKFFSTQLKVSGATMGRLAADFKKFGGEADERAAGNGGPGSDVTSTNGGPLGGMGLNEMMQLGTLGMMGAGMYCSISGKCSPKKESSDPIVPEQYPNQLANNQAAPEIATSALESKESGGASSPLGPTPGGETPDKSSSASPGYSPASFGSGGLSSPFSSGSSPGSPARAPASTGPVGGGGGLLSSGSSSSENPAAGAGTQPSADASPTDHSLNIGGGGGGGGGGFSLGGDTPSTAAADEALKSVLNGDGLPPLGGDSGLGDALAGVGAGGAAGDEPQIAGEGNLFFRVRDAYVRCVKRGCVAHEIGESI